MNWLKRRVAGYAEAIAFLAILGVCAGFFARFHYLLDLCTHFRMAAILGLVICGVLILLFSKRKWFGWVSLVGGVALIISILPFYIGKQKPSGNGETKRLLVFNVLTSNPEKQKVVDYIISKNPDVVVLLEIDVVWKVALTKQLSGKYPHYIERTRADNFGIAAFSKVPFQSAEICYLGDEVPSVDLYFENLRIIGTHPVPPIGGEYWRSKNSQLKALAETVTSDVPTIVCGDMNSTLWSPFMKDFLKTTELLDSAKGYGVKPTWYRMGMGLPIDHVFHSGEIAVRHREVGPDLGSDHRAIIVDFELPNQ